MSERSFFKSHKQLSATKGVDTLNVETILDSDWTHITMNIHGTHEDRITVRSRDHLSQLHHMIGLVLESGK